MQLLIHAEHGLDGVVHGAVGGVQALLDGALVAVVVIIVHDALTAERGVEVVAVRVEADAVGGVAAVNELLADRVQVLKALQILGGVNTGLGEHILVVVDAGIGIALRIADLLAVLVLIGRADGFPRVVELLPGTLLLHVDELLNGNAVVLVGVHGDVLDRAVEHGGQLALLGGADLRVHLSLAALRLADHMVLRLAGVEGIDNLLILVLHRLTEVSPDRDLDRAFGFGTPVFGGILLLAAGHEAQRHDEGKDECKDLFHTRFSFFIFIKHGCRVLYNRIGVSPPQRLTCWRGWRGCRGQWPPEWCHWPSG